jgi:flagellar motor component MotA
LTTPPSPNLRQQLRDIISPQALVAALAAAAVAALVGKLTAYLFVALAIFLGA